MQADLGRIEADPTRLRELFANLFRNVIEHGSEDVTITVGRTESGFFVADDGPGIPAAEREQVFEHGYPSTPDGTGFGLAIVSTIAEAHGWTVAVADGDEGGVRFDIERRSSETSNSTTASDAAGR